MTAASRYFPGCCLHSRPNGGLASRLGASVSIVSRVGHSSVKRSVRVRYWRGVYRSLGSWPRRSYLATVLRLRKLALAAVCPCVRLFCRSRMIGSTEKGSWNVKTSDYAPISSEVVSPRHKIWGVSCITYPNFRRAMIILTWVSVVVISGPPGPRLLSLPSLPSGRT